jgi:hypothetical protein
MSQKLIKTVVIPQTKQNQPHPNIFLELEKRHSILLTLFNTENKEVINICTRAPAPSKDYCQIILNFDKVHDFINLSSIIIHLLNLLR